MTRRTIIRALVLLLTGVILTVVLVQQSPQDVGRRGSHWAVGVSSEVAGCTIVGGERYGFATDLVDSLALRGGHTSEVSINLSTENILEALKVGSLDVAVITAHEKELFADYPTKTLYTTNYKLLTPSWASPPKGDNFEEAWSGKRILSESSFHHTHTFSSLAKAGAKCDSTILKCMTMAQILSAGKASAVVCTPEVASLARFFYRNIREVGTINEPCEVVAVFANNNIHKEFCQELTSFSRTESYAQMESIYFDGGSLSEHFEQLRYQPTRVVDGISVWDNQLREVASKIGVDWRLMSAMAYHESRYRNDQISSRGAVGLMQVTPIVAQEFELQEGYDLSDPSTNITLAAKLLRRSSRALGFGDFPSSDDGIAIVVASYNCGITRTLEAQRLCKLYGGNKYSWRDVAEMFRNMSDNEWIATHDYRMRRFGDAEITIAYTEGVMELYDTYRSSVEK